jgi:hypothetical protein
MIKVRLLMDGLAPRSCEGEQEEQISHRHNGVEDQ